jgi:hypothetical protein
VRSRAEVAFVLELVRAGWNDCEIARQTGIPGEPSGIGEAGAFRISTASERDPVLMSGVVLRAMVTR